MSNKGKRLGYMWVVVLYYSRGILNWVGVFLFIFFKVFVSWGFYFLVLDDMEFIM